MRAIRQARDVSVVPSTQGPHPISRCPACCLLRDVSCLPWCPHALGAGGSGMLGPSAPRFTAH